MRFFSMLAVLLVITTIVLAGELVPLSPKKAKRTATDNMVITEPGNPWTDDEILTHVDGVADYYLSSGSANDTFFIVFEPLAACSVLSVEVSWYTAGNFDAFAADYSAAAEIAFPGGIAPERGTTDISPIGEFITNLHPNSAIATQDWEEVELGSPFVIGDIVTLQPDLFGIGLIKNSDYPDPLADDVSAYGVNYSYTWFGGPWMPSHGYDHVWGSYSSDYTGTVIELMIRAWVSYYWGVPILISDLTDLPDTYNLTEPFPITVTLIDDNGITNDDTIELVYTVNGGAETRVDLVDVPPVGDDVYGAEINFAGTVNDVVDYWVETVDDQGLMNNAPEPPYSFTLLQPENPEADILFIRDAHLYDEEMNAFDEYFLANGLEPEIWNVEEHNGIDESVVNWGWNKVYLIGWGCTVIPALDEQNVFEGFLESGGRLLYSDQDYFFANGLPVSGEFGQGDFAYDYFGVYEYENDPMPVDSGYYGVDEDPITSEFEDVPYWTSPDGNEWMDYFVPVSVPIFYGEADDNVYGCRNDQPLFRTVYLSFNAWWGCDKDGFGVYHTNDQFNTLMNNIYNWFDEEMPDVSIELIPYGAPIQIPVSGGSFEFNISLTNNETTPSNVDVWTMVTLPNGNLYGPIINSALTFPALWSGDRDRQQVVPAAAPAGDYIYHGYIGTYPDLIYDEDSFSFIKLTGQ